MLNIKIALALWTVIGLAANIAHAEICPPHCGTYQENRAEDSRAAVEQQLSTRVLLVQHADIQEYDCSLMTISKLRKCKISIVAPDLGVKVTLLASPEVAAPYSNSYDPIEGRPMTNLFLVLKPTKKGSAYLSDSTKVVDQISDGEVIEIMDSTGRVVTRKIDYSR